MRGRLSIGIFLTFFLYPNEFLKDVMDAYKRPFTVIEFSPRGHSYALEYAKGYPQSAFVIIVA